MRANELRLPIDGAYRYIFAAEVNSSLQGREGGGMEAKKGSEILDCFGYSEKCSTSLRELIAGVISDFITRPLDCGEYYRTSSEESRGGYVHPTSVALNEASKISQGISDSLASIHFVLSELERLVCRARLPELPSGELSELEAMGRELSEGFAKHAAFSLTDGRRPLQGEVVDIQLKGQDLGKISFPSKVLSPLILGPLSFSTREELLQTEITLCATRSQLYEYYREVELFSKAIAEGEIRVDIVIQNEAASVTSPCELELIIEKLGITARAA